jgi:hypothetical protein
LSSRVYGQCHHIPLNGGTKEALLLSCEPFPTATEGDARTGTLPGTQVASKVGSISRRRDSHEEKIRCSGRAASGSRINRGNRSIRTGGLWTPSSSPPSPPPSSLRDTAFPDTRHHAGCTLDYRYSLHGDPSVGRKPLSNADMGHMGDPIETLYRVLGEEHESLKQAREEAGWEALLGCSTRISFP